MKHSGDLAPNFFQISKLENNLVEKSHFQFVQSFFSSYMTKMEKKITILDSEIKLGPTFTNFGFFPGRTGVCGGKYIIVLNFHFLSKDDFLSSQLGWV